MSEHGARRSRLSERGLPASCLPALQIVVYKRWNICERDKRRFILEEAFKEGDPH